jgi:hypothetical protein
MPEQVLQLQTTQRQQQIEQQPWAFGENAA